MATNAPGEGRGGVGGGSLGNRTAGEPVSRTGVLGVVGVVALVAIAIALFLMEGSMSNQNCIRKAEAQFPTVPVSAFVPNRRNPQTGPLKVSFSKERADAVKAC